MRLIHVEPAPGFRILNPFAGFKELPTEGVVTPDDGYWRQREREGGVIIKAAN